MGLLRTRLQGDPRFSLRSASRIAFRRHGTARFGIYGAKSMRLARALSMQGDPGLFSFLGGAIKRVGGAALGAASLFAPGFVGKAAGIAKSIGPAVAGGVASGAAAGLLGGMLGGKRGEAGGTRRKMNWANPRALSRAERRMGSFIKHFTKSARHLGYHVSRGPARRATWPKGKR